MTSLKRKNCKRLSQSYLLKVADYEKMAKKVEKLKSIDVEKDGNRICKLIGLEG